MGAGGGGGSRRAAGERDLNYDDATRLARRQVSVSRVKCRLGEEVNPSPDANTVACRHSALK